MNRLAFNNGQAYCHYQVFDTMHQKNQIIRSTFSSVSANRAVWHGPDKGGLRSDTHYVNWCVTWTALI